MVDEALAQAGFEPVAERASRLRLTAAIERRCERERECRAKERGAARRQRDGVAASVWACCAMRRGPAVTLTKPTQDVLTAVRYAWQRFGPSKHGEDGVRQA